jgi:Na+/H+ antiporter NhaC
MFNAESVPSSILTVSPNTHYIAIILFAIAAILYYFFTYTSMFKTIKNLFTASKSTDDKSNEATDINDSEDEIYENNLESTNMQELISPF